MNEKLQCFKATFLNIFLTSLDYEFDNETRLCELKQLIACLKFIRNLFSILRQSATDSSARRTLLKPIPSLEERVVKFRENMTKLHLN